MWGPLPSWLPAGSWQLGLATGLVGLVGDARSDLNPEGGVYVKGSIWRARSTDGFIPKGTRVRVKGIDGLILRVEEEPD